MKKTTVLTEKGLTRAAKEKITKVGFSLNAVALSFMLASTRVYAAGSNTDSIDGFIDFICDWLAKIGGVVALVGGVLFALGWQREDAEGKSRGLMTLMAGFMLIAISQAPDIFGL